ncbi:MAG: CAP domain-containing protein [Candidatus Aminicenantes bacterium]|nr:MAG: CAP domain-containing protein [Candidatus Aminicenantes bacterium]
MKKSLMALMMMLWAWTLCLAVSPQHPDISAIEEKLLELLNKERTARNLSPLNFSQDLRAVATGHSTDMASQQYLTHLSSSGKSYLDRMVDSGLFFIEIGENVAVSDTFDAAFIHQGFMESPEHKDNILNPRYDTIGIGVVLSKDQEYFITQDFSQSLKLLEADEAEKFVQDEITKIREANALPPLSFHTIAGNFARRQSRYRASGKPLQNVAGYFGETHVHHITTPVLALPKDISREIAREIYEMVAVGAWFGRLEDYPGGTYLITIFLFPMSPYKGMTEEDFSEIVLNVMNSKREEIGLGPVKLDKGQSRYASNISRNLKYQRTSSYSLPRRPMSRQVISYVTEDPFVWPANLDPVITDPGLIRIGIGISSIENKNTHRQTFWITLIF